MSIRRGRVGKAGVVWLALAGVGVTVSAGLAAGGRGEDGKLGLPPAGKFYLGVYPGGKTGEEDDITAEEVLSYEQTVGQRVAWVYFSDNWYRGREFPTATCSWIRQLGAVPFIRLMLRSNSKEVAQSLRKNPPPYPPLPVTFPAPLLPAAPAAAPGGPAATGETPVVPKPPQPRVVEPVFTVPAILEGKFDDDLRAWARTARAFGTPVLVEWGTECNGDWFPWNGKYWGGADLTGFGDPTKPDGPERFVAAYRHIVTLMREAGANNLTWVWHVNWDDQPDEDWNHFENYYPGDDVVDWLGVSCYGALTPQDKDEPESLEAEMKEAYPRLAAVAAGKPIMLLEFGETAGNPKSAPEDWAQEALDHLLAHRWPRVRGFSWWNEHWENDDTPANDTTMRVQDIPALAAVWHDSLANNEMNLQTQPVYAH